MSKICLPLVAIAAIISTSPVFAQNTVEAAQITIRYDKSDLSSSDSRRGLERRIEFAVNNVCGDVALGSKEEVDALRTCRATARSMAQAQMPISVADRGN
jgi:UrcA family protein